MRAEKFSSLVMDRHSVRDFLRTPIPDSTLEGILEDSRHVASWSNTRPYVIAVASGERLKRISRSYLKEYQAFVPIQRKEPSALAKALVGIGIPRGDYKAWKRYPPQQQERSRKIGKALYTHIGIPRGDREARVRATKRNFEFFGAPTVIWVLAHKKMLPVSAMDAGLMLQTLMLSAKARGVDSCALGSLAIWRKPLTEEFVVPKDYLIMTGVALGYASSDSVNDFRAEHPPLVSLPPREHK